MNLLGRYRSTGADLAFGRPEKAHHGVAMEGYFWRITDPESGRVIIALCGANMGPDGPWATVGLGAWPNGFLRTAAVDGAWTDPIRRGVHGGTGACGGSTHRLTGDLGGDGGLHLALQDLTPWPRQALGGPSGFCIGPGRSREWRL